MVQYNLNRSFINDYSQYVGSVWPVPGTPPPHHLARGGSSRITRCEIASLSCAIVRSSVGVAAIGVRINIAASRVCRRGVGTTVAMEAATIRAKTIASSSAATASHKSTPSAILGRHPANDKLVPLQRGGAFEDQLPGRLFLVESDEAEVLGGVVAQLVHRADHFYHSSKLREMISQVLVRDLVRWQLAHIDLALSRLRLLAGSPLPFDHVRLLGAGGNQSRDLLEHDEGKPP